MLSLLGKLVPTGGGDPIPLLEEKLRIGRRSSCDIILDYPNVSSRHCELTFENGYWHVTDLGSSNGIKVNGERCEERWLHPGDELAIAKHFFLVDYEALGDAPPPKDEEEDPFELGLLEKAGLQKERSEQRRRKRQLPPAAKKPPQKRFDADEEAAADWLMDD